jgi:hypothetical protein
MARISEYTVPCPTCHESGIETFLGFDTDLGISCTAEEPHVFDELPGESGPVLSDIKPAETNATEAENTVSETRLAKEGPGKIAEIMASRNAKSEVADIPSDEVLKRNLERIAAQIDEGPAPEAPLGGRLVSELPEGNPIPAGAPVAAEGQFVRLPNGDILCGVRVSEAWVGAMQSEGECKTPPQNAAQYLQEIIDLGLLSWYSNAPVG